MGGRIGQKEIERLVREVADLEQDLLQRLLSKITMFVLFQELQARMF